jgi:hypothetical protein
VSASWTLRLVRTLAEPVSRNWPGVDGSLDREQQIGAGPLDLVEQDRAREAGHEIPRGRCSLTGHPLSLHLSPIGFPYSLESSPKLHN